MAETTLVSQSLNVPPELAHVAIPQREFFKRNPKYTNIAVGGLVFSGDHLLLVQRSSSDAFPNCWEVPGGSCEDYDETIPHGAAREVLEEAGLVVTRVVRQINLVDEWNESKRGRHACWAKLTFEVEVAKPEDYTGQHVPIKLDPKEHQQYLWVTEDEVKASQAGEIKFTWISTRNQQTMLEAFRLRKLDKASQT